MAVEIPPERGVTMRRGRKLHILLGGLLAAALTVCCIAPAKTAEAKTRKKAAAANPIQVVAEYTEVEPLLDVTYHYIVVQSTVNRPLAVTANTVATNAAGATVGADNEYLDVIRPGHQELITEMFDNTTDAATFQTTFSTSDSCYEDAAASVLVTAQPGEDKLIVTLTNAGTIPAEFCNATVLFFRSGQVVGHDYTYFVDSEEELKPGASLSNQFDFYDETRTDFMTDTGSFDSYLVFTEGRYYNG